MRSVRFSEGVLGTDHRGSCPFEYGNTIGFGERISKNSAMTAFLVFIPAVLDAADCVVDVGIPGHEGHDIIHIKGLYPIHEMERQFIAEHGPETFWGLEWDPYDVTRLPAV